MPNLTHKIFDKLLKSARVLVSENVDLINISSNIFDGIACEQNDRLLLVSQNNAKENGVYIFQPGLPLKRSNDDVDSGFLILILEGTHANELWASHYLEKLSLNVDDLIIFQITTNNISLQTRKFSKFIGNDFSKEFLITQAEHGCATNATNIVKIIDVVTGAEVECNVIHANNGNITLNFMQAPLSNQYNITVIG